jgi:uncharacterized protein YggT (Ycf19 family)
MSLIDFILNVAGLLLWLNWRAVRPSQRVAPPSARWWFLAGLAALLVGRAVFYWQAGTRLNWVPDIPLGPTALLFRSDLPARMLLYSLFSFGATLGFFYLCLLFLSVVNASVPEANPVQRLVRLHLGWLERWPNALKVLLPLLLVTALWGALHPLLFKIGLVPAAPPRSLLAQGAVIGLAAYLALQYLILGFLILYVLNSYVYLGDSLFLDFVNNTSRGMLRPLRWLPLRIGRVDLAPLAGMVLVILPGWVGQLRFAQVLNFPFAPHLF